MKSTQCCYGISILFLSCMFVSLTFGDALKVSLAQMPVYAENAEKGILVDMVKAIAEVSGKKLDLQVVPFKRSLDNVVTKKVDFHAPLIQNPTVDENSLSYDHSTVTIFHVNFTLYTNKNKPLNRDKLGEYTIETDAAHTTYFPFKTVPSSDLAASIKKVDMGRIDGFIFADLAIDPLIPQFQLKNVQRQLYQRFDVKAILPKKGKGGPIDKLLTAAKQKLDESGTWTSILGPIDQPYSDLAH